MSVVNDIVERARSYLTTGWLTGLGRGGRILPEVVFDHSGRVLETAKELLHDSAMVEGTVDEPILVASAMFHDAGWIDLVRRKELEAGQIYSRPADAALLDRGASAASEQLANILSLRQLEKVTDVITSLRAAHPDQPEAVVIADAENLEEFGLLGVFQQVRGAQAGGKSARQILESWNRQQEYHYWDARIKNAFHLETSRKIAAQRLIHMGRAFELLCREISLEDVRSQSAGGRREGERTNVKHRTPNIEH